MELSITVLENNFYVIRGIVDNKEHFYIGYKNKEKCINDYASISKKISKKELDFKNQNSEKAPDYIIDLWLQNLVKNIIKNR